jgi:hypothetical protein
MNSVTLVHPEETLIVSALEAMPQCSLFEENPILTTFPYRVQSAVSLSIFREFVKELEGTPIKVTGESLRELQRLCEEFGFDKFSTKLSKVFEYSICSEGGHLQNAFAGMRNGFWSEPIEFVVNETVIDIEIAEVAALFPSVREQLSVDGCTRTFFVNVSGIEAPDIRSLELLLLGEWISIGSSPGLLLGFLGNADLERLLLGCLKAENRINLSALMKERRLDFESVDVSIVSVEALDSLLLNDSISIESEDALLRVILKLGSGYRDLLRHIRLECLSEDGFSFLEGDLGIPLESVEECAAKQISHPPRRLFDSQIIADLPEILADFRGKRFSLLWLDSRDGFGSSVFHRRCGCHANNLTVILDTERNIFGGFTPLA